MATATFRGVLLAIPLAACIPPPAAAPEAPEPTLRAPESAQEVLDRHIAALGGPSALRALSERSVEGRVVFRDHPACEEAETKGCIDGDLVGQLVLHATADGRLFRRMVVQEQINERGFDGKRGWTLLDGTVLELEGVAASLASKEDALLHWYLDLAERDIVPELAEPIEKGHDGTTRIMDGLRWKAAHGKLPPRTMWFDRETGLLREEVEEISPQEQMVIVYDDYRDVDGVKVAFSIHQLRVGEESRPDVDIVVQTVHHRGVTASNFAVPTLLPPEPEPDPILVALGQARDGAAANKKEPLAQLALARVAFAAGHFEDARDAAERVLRLKRVEPEAAFIAGRTRLMLGDARGARRFLKRAHDTGLKNEVYALQSAWVHSLERDWPDAADALERAGAPELAELYSASADPAYRLERGTTCDTTIPAHREPGSLRIAIEATVEGQSTRLMIDTGSRDLLLGQSFAGRQLITREVDSPLGGGGPGVPHAYIDTVELGAFKLRAVPTAIVPDSALEKIAAGVDGVIGVRPLMQFLVAVDGAAGEVRLISGDRRCARLLASERKGAVAPLYVHETHYVYTRATIGPSEAVLAINTGMNGADAALNGGAFARAGVGPPPILDGAPMPATLAPVSVGEVALPPLEAAYGAFENQVTTDSFRIDGLIGLRPFGDMRVVFDFPARALYARPSAAAAAKPVTQAPTPVTQAPQRQPPSP